MSGDCFTIYKLLTALLCQDRQTQRGVRVPVHQPHGALGPPPHRPGVHPPALRAGGRQEQGLLLAVPGPDLQAHLQRQAARLQRGRGQDHCDNI